MSPSTLLQRAVAPLKGSTAIQDAAAWRPRAGPTWLPAGRDLLDRDVAWRSRAVRIVLAGHLPLLLVLALLEGAGAAFVLALTAGIGVLLTGSILLPGRRLQSLSATAGLLAASAALTALYGERAEAHVFLVAVVIALYQDWAVYALAVIAVLLHHGVVAPLTGSTLDGHPGQVWPMAVLHSGIVALESLALLLFWRANRFTRSTEQRAMAELSAGRSSVQARLDETDRMRADLIGTVSHEFRTPLTSIRAAALTLLKHGDRIDAARREKLLQAVLEGQERLSRLLENMLTAAEATAVDPDATAEVDAVAAEVAMLAAVGRETGVSVVVTAGTTARIDRPALHQVLANLVDNALQHGVPGSVPLVAGGEDGRGVWLTVSNEGRTLDPSTTGRLFEPFTQGESGATRSREGIGVGLYVVRRLVEVYGGSVDVRSDSGWVTVEVRLDSASRQPVLTR